MSKIKLGSREFDVDCEEINAGGCGVSAADCSALAARMRTGEISRVKGLYLVSFFSVLFLFLFLQYSPFLRFSTASFHRATTASLSLPHATSLPAFCTTPSSPRFTSTTSPPPVSAAMRGCRQV